MRHISLTSPLRMKSVYGAVTGGMLLLSTSACHHLEAERQAQLGQTQFQQGNAAQENRGPRQNADTGGLSAQELKPGDCGLFLWATNDTRRPLVFFHLTGSQVAQGLLGGQAQRLQLLGQSDGVIPGLYQRAQYSVGEGSNKTVRLRLQVEQGGTMLTGIKIPGGIMTLDDPKDGARVTPVTGLYACQVAK